MLRKFGVLVASLVMVLVSSLAVVLVPATPAAAGGSIGGDGRVTGDSPAGTPDSDGVWQYEAPPTGVMVGWMSCLPSGCEYYCPNLSDGTKATSWGSWEKTVGRYDSYTIRRWCNYPPLPTVTDVFCATSVAIQGFGPMSEPGPPVAMARKTKQSAWSQTATSRKDAGLCGGTVSLAAGFQMRKLGKFYLDVIKGRTPCKRVDYGPTQPAVIKDCGEVNTDTKVYYAQQWCGGSHQDWVNRGHTFTMDECMDTTGTFVVCNVPKVRLDLGGWGAPNSVLDDGSKHKAKWAGTTLTGSAVDHPVIPLFTRVTVKRDGPSPSTPFRPGASQNGSTQPFQGVPGTGGVGGDVTAMDHLQFHRASMPGQPWILERWVTEWSNFKVSSIAIVSVDLLSDSDRLVPGPVIDIHVPGRVECPSAPLSVTVKRAHNVR